MKKIFIVIALFAISCKSGISDKDKTYIDGQIALHNATVGLQYKLRNASDPNVSSDTNMIKSGVNYEPDFDPNLTYERFVNYCTSNKKNPVEVAEHLTTK
jgi:hypothetical protein